MDDLRRVRNQAETNKSKLDELIQITGVNNFDNVTTIGYVPAEVTLSQTRPPE